MNIAEIKEQLEREDLYMHSWEEEALLEGNNKAEWKEHMVDSSDCHSPGAFMHKTTSLCWAGCSYMPPWWYELAKGAREDKHIPRGKEMSNEKARALRDLKRFEIMGVIVPEPSTTKPYEGCSVARL